MWRGTKEDPQGLGRLNATRFIPSNPAALQAPPTRTTQKTVPEPSTATPEDLHAAHHPFCTFSAPAKISAPSPALTLICTVQQIQAFSALTPARTQVLSLE